MDENPSTAWTGTCGFRMLPTDDFAQGPSTARLTEVAGGAALTLDYTWVHPEQGEQAGHLVLGRPDDDGRVTVAFTDSFHQSPEVRVLEGTAARTEGGGDAGRDRGAGAAPHPIDGDGVAVTMEYSGWGWTVAVRRQGGRLAMMMQNVVPAGVEGAEPGPYDVMRAAWTPAGA